MNKITVVCHKDHSQGYEDFEGKCLLCVVDDLMLEIGNLMIQKRRAEKPKMRRTTRDEKIVNPGVYEVPVFDCPRCGHCCRADWVGLTDEEIQVLADPCKQPLVFRFSEYARAIEAKLKEKNI